MNARGAPARTPPDVADRPLVAIGEATRACALACRHCRTTAHRRPRSDALTTLQARGLLVQIGRIHPSEFVSTGGDPLERADLFALIAEPRDSGLGVSVAPSITRRLDRRSIAALAALDCAGVQLSVDGADAETHDRFRGHRGRFARTLQRLDPKTRASRCRWQPPSRPTTPNSWRS